MDLIPPNASVNRDGASKQETGNLDACPCSLVYKLLTFFRRHCFQGVDHLCHRLFQCVAYCIPNSGGREGGSGNRIHISALGFEDVIQY